MLDFEGKRIFCVRYAKMKYTPFLKPQQDKTKVEKHDKIMRDEYFF